MSMMSKLILTAVALLLVAAAPAPTTQKSTLEVTGTLIVLNKAEASASLLDCSTGREIAKLPTGDGPHEVAVSPDGRAAGVGNYGTGEPGHTLTVIDLPKQAVRKTVDLGDHHRPHGIQFLPGGRSVIVTAEHEQHVLVVDVESGAVEKSVKTGQRISHMVVLGKGAERAFVSSIGSGTVSVIDLTSAEVIATIETGTGAEGIDISPDGREVWVGNRGSNTLSVIDASSLEIVETVPCAEVPIRVKFTPRGELVFVSNARSGDVAVFNASTRKPLTRIAMTSKAVDDTSDRLFKDRMGRGPVPVGILIEPTGRYAFVANTNADVVTVIDLATSAIATRLTAGTEPDGLGYTPIVLDR
jgi:YVTN family beta-propeller protein